MLKQTIPFLMRLGSIPTGLHFLLLGFSFLTTCISIFIAFFLLLTAPLAWPIVTKSLSNTLRFVRFFFFFFCWDALYIACTYIHVGIGGMVYMPCCLLSFRTRRWILPWNPPEWRFGTAFDFDEFIKTVCNTSPSLGAFAFCCLCLGFGITGRGGGFVLFFSVGVYVMMGW